MQKLGIPDVNPIPFVGNLKECVFQKVSIGKYLKEMYEAHSDKPYVGIFSFDKPSLLIRDVEPMKNILVKVSQSFIDHMMTVNAQPDSVFGRGLFMRKSQIWGQVRTSLTPMFTSGKECGKESYIYIFAYVVC
jgi:cytochrome P450 family 6